MEHIAVLVDGAETPAADGSVGFAVGAIRQPRRPVAGLAIAVLTAVVTMGALGPHLGDGDTATAAVCAVPAATPVAAVAAQVPTVPVASPVPWWLLPQVAEWVDPATGRSMQARVDRESRVVHDRHQVR